MKNNYNIKKFENSYWELPYPWTSALIVALSSSISILKVSSGCKPPVDLGVFVPLFSPLLDLPPELKKLAIGFQKLITLNELYKKSAAASLNSTRKPYIILISALGISSLIISAQILTHFVDEEFGPTKSRKVSAKAKL